MHLRRRKLELFTMSATHLGVYLHDHRAGAVAAVELLKHLEQSKSDAPVAGFAAALRSEIEADIRELDELMNRAGISPSAVRNVGAWLTAKMAELKLQLTIRLTERCGCWKRSKPLLSASTASARCGSRSRRWQKNPRLGWRRFWQPEAAS